MYIGSFQKGCIRCQMRLKCLSITLLHCEMIPPFHQSGFMMSADWAHEYLCEICAEHKMHLQGVSTVNTWAPNNVGSDNYYIFKTVAQSPVWFCQIPVSWSENPDHPFAEPQRRFVTASYRDILSPKAVEVYSGLVSEQRMTGITIIIVWNIFVTFLCVG